MCIIPLEIFKNNNSRASTSNRIVSRAPRLEGIFKMVKSLLDQKLKAIQTSDECHFKSSTNMIFLLAQSPAPNWGFG